MASFTRAATVATTPSKVFALLTDLRQVSIFMPDVTHIEVLTKGDFGVGTRWKETRRIKLFGFIPVSGSAVIEVTEFEKNKRYTTVADDGCNWAAYTFTTKSAGAGKSKVVLEGHFKMVGKCADKPRKAESLARFCEKADGHLLERVKSHIEG